MERSFINPDSAASTLFNFPVPSANPFAFHIATQQPPVQHRPSAIALSPSLLVSAAFPGQPTLSFSTSTPTVFGSPQGALFQSNSSLSPDPPAAGPPSNMTPGSSRALGGSVATATSPFVAALPPRARRRASRRATPPAVASIPVAAPGSEDHAVRRSTRSRKRAPVAASLPAASRRDESRDPPAKKPKRGNLKAPPPSLKSDDSEDTKPEGELTASCCICMDDPKPVDLASISGCEHLFCFDCIEKWAERENTCPLCKVRFTKIDRVNKAKKKGGERAKNTKRVKQKDQRSDLAPGAALEGLLASFAASANFPPHRVARLIFSGMGANPFIMPGSASLRASRTGAAAGRASALEDSLFSSDTDDDEEAASFLPAPAVGPPSFADLFRAMPRGPGIIVGGNLHSLRSVNFPVFDPPSGRSYASNSGDRNAGRQAENPLEIDDDSDEEEIEVVQVRRPI